MADYEDEMICDLAQVYGVYDWRTIPPANAAIMALGLPDSSRVKLKISGKQFSFECWLQMQICDRLNWLQWSRSRAHELGYPPPLPLEELIKQSDIQAQKQEEQRLMGFDSPEELNNYIENQRCGGGGEKVG